MEEIHGSRTRSTRRRFQRKVLADLTNTPSTAAATNVPLKSTSSDPNRTPPSIRCSSRIRSSVLKNHGDEAISAATPKSKKIATISDWHAVTYDENSIVYKRRSKAGRKGKEKAVAASAVSSCPPIIRTRSIEGNLNLESGKDNLPKEHSVPYQHTEKKRRYTLPLDFVEKQKKYFAEVDAFELPEEFVSENDSD